MLCDALYLHLLWRLFRRLILEPGRNNKTCDRKSQSKSLEIVQMKLTFLILSIVALSTPRIIRVRYYRADNFNLYGIGHCLTTEFSGQAASFAGCLSAGTNC